MATQIRTADIADLQVTGAKLANDTVTATQLDETDNYNFTGTLQLSGVSVATVNQVNAAQEGLDAIKAKYPEAYAEISKRAKLFHEAFNFQLKQQLDNKIISKDVYDDLVRYDYVPMKNIAYVIEDLLSDVDNFRSSANKSLIDRLKEGSEENISVAFEDLLKLQIQATQRKISTNTAATRLAEAALRLVRSTLSLVQNYHSQQRVNSACSFTTLGSSPARRGRGPTKSVDRELVEFSPCRSQSSGVIVSINSSTVGGSFW